MNALAGRAGIRRRVAERSCDGTSQSSATRTRSERFLAMRFDDMADRRAELSRRAQVLVEVATGIDERRFVAVGDQSGIVRDSGCLDAFQFHDRTTRTRIGKRTRTARSITPPRCMVSHSCPLCERARSRKGPSTP